MIFIYSTVIWCDMWIQRCLVALPEFAKLAEQISANLLSHGLSAVSTRVDMDVYSKSIQESRCIL